MSKNPKIIFITGTPGVGKSTIAIKLNEILSKKYNSVLFKLNEIAISNDLILGEDLEKGYKILNLPKIDEKLKELIKFNTSHNLMKIAIVEGHTSHFLSNPDKIIVLRLNPETLKERLEKRDYFLSKINDNLEVEALAICSSESYDLHGEKVNELDTTNLSIEDVVNKCLEIIIDDIHYPVGNIDFMEWFLK
ncbi:adenylate kinase family protein [Methanobrevibacter filiformis]|uniref:Putative adenylate kinase n=1 Tax=Methanobrevibacter filiformis TaxID=55758 RepID=A0A166E337_9EURY|nr:adenylate kinase family protein [Methanobrevibacter filiformis]KZX16226.1 cytidylate kinase [Methanobrevibacter filiformis]